MFEKYVEKFGNPNLPKGKIKLTNFLPLSAEDEDIDFLAMLGVKYVYSETSQGVPMFKSMDRIEALKERLAKRGMILNHCHDRDLVKNRDLILATEKRDEVIERFARMLECQAKLDLHDAIFTWEADEYQRNENVYVRGGAMSCMVDEREMEKWPAHHGRIYEKDEMWDNFTYFMKQIIPVCERTGVYLALHPCDPPIPMVYGAASLITSYEDYKKAFAIANSKMLGMEFCCGCWLEGGERFGDIPSAFKEFAAEGRIRVTHFRNISSPLPYFEERFIDDGYADMYKLMENIYEADYDGALILDHSPRMIQMTKTDKWQSTTHPGESRFDPGQKEAIAYAIGYIKALMNVASKKIIK